MGNILARPLARSSQLPRVRASRPGIFRYTVVMSRSCLLNQADSIRIRVSCDYDQILVARNIPNEVLWYSKRTEPVRTINKRLSVSSALALAETEPRGRQSWTFHPTVARSLDVNSPVQFEERQTHCLCNCLSSNPAKKLLKLPLSQRSIWFWKLDHITRSKVAWNGPPAPALLS
ncbi:hypothetical protein KL939_003634 [Ogataea angusta]|nr:hypothetical protein KL939_003634 [Ogataea angusta]